MILWVSPNSIYSVILRTSEFPIVPFFSFCKFMYCLVFFTSCGFILRKILLEFQHFIAFRSILPEKGFTILLGAAETLILLVPRGLTTVLGKSFLQ